MDLFSFNPRTREGANGVITDTPLTSLCFNPRTREGANTMDNYNEIAVMVSIHAPVKVRTACGAHACDF